MKFTCELYPAEFKQLKDWVAHADTHQLPKWHRRKG